MTIYVKEGTVFALYDAVTDADREAQRAAGEQVASEHDVIRRASYPKIAIVYAETENGLVLITHGSPEDMEAWVNTHRSVKGSATVHGRVLPPDVPLEKLNAAIANPAAVRDLLL